MGYRADGDCLCSNNNLLVGPGVIPGRMLFLSVVQILFEGGHYSTLGTARGNMVVTETR